MSIFQKIFPCRFNTCKGFFGCKCGSFGKAKSSAEEGIQRAGQQVYQAGKMLPEEEAAYLDALRKTPELQAISRYLAGMGEKPGGYISPEAQYLREAGPIGRGFYEQTRQRLEQPFAYYDPMDRLYDPMKYYYDPETLYQSTFPEKLQMAEDYINRQAQGRGLVRSGIPIEEMGRAGVELVVREAERRLQLAREKAEVGLGLERERYGMLGELEQEREAMRQQGLAGAGEFTTYAQGQVTENLARLANLYSQQQQFGQAALGRQAAQTQAAGQYWAYPGQAQLGSVYGKQAALWALPGQFLSAAGQAAGASYGAKT